MPLSTDHLKMPWEDAGHAVGGYFDSASGRWFVVARPADAPQLWSAYIEGAWRTYREHGVEGAVDFDEAGDGRSTSLFFAAVEADGRVSGGLRVQGPYSHVQQAHAVREWAGRKGTEELLRQIGRRIADGVIEIKAVWVDRDADRHSELTAALARAFVHSLALMDVRYAFCTAASHAVRRWESSGGVVIAEVLAVPYPDGRYETCLMCWDRQDIFRRITPDQIRSIVRESDQLFRHPVPAAPSAA